MLTSIKIKFLFLLLLFTYNYHVFAVTTIFTNHPLSSQDKRYEYPQKLLDRVLSITSEEFGASKLSSNGLSMNRTRALTSLIEGKNLHVMAEAPKPEWNEKLLVVRIPIRKGIQGFRLFLSKDEHKAHLSQINTFEEFKLVPTGSGEHWSTTSVLQEAGFNVVKGIDYEGLFGMLMRKRFIVFGRGINEIFEEFDQRHSALNELIIDKRFLLYIPLPTYFFVTPTKPELRNRIELGLKRLITSGEFDKIFEAEFGDLIEKAKLDKRIKFSISNPNLSEEDPLKIKEYWYTESH
ncbi:MAG: hypothetical protein ACI8O8_000946 [Oleiphilaceae bacterium]|jgi:hypothetical protein